MHTGSCLCGRVRYRYDAEIEEVSMCHCTQCQKAQGSAFVAVAPIVAAQFAITQGKEFLKEFRALAHKARVFCKECASPLYSVRDDLPQVLRLRIGTLETPIRPKMQYHGFVASKAAWYEINDDHPQYQGLPPP